MYTAPDMTRWQGRIDPGAEALRWHQHIQPLEDTSQPGIVLLGVNSDEGVSRNKGRTGACLGPEILRKALSSLPCKHNMTRLYDGGDITCDQTDLEAMQQLQAEKLSAFLGSGHLPVVLGGGHEIAAGSFMALADTRSENKRLGIINFDAHFDLRPDPVPTSGTPFRQAARRCTDDGQEFRYLCLGIAETANTQALFNDANKLGVKWLRDDELAPWQLDKAMAVVQTFLDDIDELHLSIDLDAFPASVAPGVSAPAARGVELSVAEVLLDKIRESGKVRLIDIAELNPKFDIDHHTARLAARLAHRLVV